MLRLTDSPSGRVETLTGRRLRVGYPSRSLRSALTADTLRRVAERRRMLVTLHQLPYRPHQPDTAGHARYNMPPPAAGRPEGPIDVYVGESADDAPEGVRIRVVHAPSAPRAAHRGPVPHPGDPLALRLLLLGLPRHEPLRCSRHGYEGADEAGRVLGRLRETTAVCAESPSAAMPKEAVEAVLDALEDDLDTARAIRLLTGLADAGDLPAGARFEALAHLDRFVALDLARDVGRPRD